MTAAWPWSTPAHFHSVALESSSSRSVTVLEGLSLTVGPDGLTTAEGPGGAVHTAPWTEVSSARCGPPSTMPDGRPATVVSARVDGRLMRWLVPAAQLPADLAAQLDQVIRTLSTEAQPGLPPLPSFWAGPGPAPAPPAAPAGPSPPPPPPPPPAVPAPAPPPPAAPAVDWRHAPPPSGATAPSPARHAHRLSPLMVVLLAAALVLAVVAVVLPVAGGPGRGGSTESADRVTAGAVNITLADAPAGWTIDHSKNGPLSGFSSGGGGSGGVSASEQERLQAQFASCLGTSGGPLFAPQQPTASAVSPALSDPGGVGPTEALSVTQVYASAGDVAASLAVVARPKFAVCAGQVIGAEILPGIEQSLSQGLTASQPQVTALALPSLPGVTAAGVSVVITVAGGTSSVPSEFILVFLGAGRIESLLTEVAVGQPFPAPVTSSLTTTLEHNLAAASTGTDT